MNENTPISSISPWEISHQPSMDDTHTTIDDNLATTASTSSDEKSYVNIDDIAVKEDSIMDSVEQNQEAQETIDNASSFQHTKVFETPELESYSMDSQNPWSILTKKKMDTIASDELSMEDEHIDSSDKQKTQNLETKFDPLKTWGVTDDASSVYSSNVAPPMKIPESLSISTHQLRTKYKKSSKHLSSTKSISSKQSNKTTKTKASDKLSTGSVLTLPSGKKIRKVKRSKARKYSNVHTDTDTCTSTIADTNSSIVENNNIPFSTTKSIQTNTGIPIAKDDQSISSSDSSLSQNLLCGRVEQTLARMKAVRNTHNVGDITHFSTKNIDSNFVGNEISIDDTIINEKDDIDVSHHSPLHHLQLIDTNEDDQDTKKDEMSIEETGCNKNDLPNLWNESDTDSTSITNIDSLPSGWITTSKSINGSESMDNVLFPNAPFPTNETTLDNTDCDETYVTDESKSQTSGQEREDKILITETKLNEETFDESSIHSQKLSIPNNTVEAMPKLQTFDESSILSQTLSISNDNTVEGIPTMPMVSSDKEEKTNQPLFNDFDPFTAPIIDVNINGVDQNTMRTVVEDDAQNDNMVQQSLEDFSETKTVVSKYGPMWKKAVILAEDELDRLDEEEYEREEKFLYIRSRAPPRINVKNQSENIRRLNERQNINLQKQAKLSQSLLAKTRSRADVDKVDGIFVAPPPTLFRASEEKDLATYSMDESSNGSIMRTASNDILITTKIARKRTKVVQLLIIGVIGVMGGFLGSIYAQSTCEFLIAKVNVGGNDNVFKLHFGMWKYSPIESAFQKYRYCNEYDDEYANESPTFIRLLVFISLLTGSFTIGVLWTYLILGLTSQAFWQNAVRMAFLSGCLQSTSFLFFFGDLCEHNACSFGPGATVSIVTTLVWFLLSYEMFHNTPTLSLLPNTSHLSASAPLMNLELPEISNHIKNKLTVFPFQPPKSDAAPSLSMLKKKLQIIKNRGKSYSQDNDDDTYCPPDYESEGSSVV